MWVFTKIGFYSVVRKPGLGSELLEVRPRRREDLERLNAKTGLKAPILENAGTDYPFRVRMVREVWAKFLGDSAMTIDYENFKEEILFGKVEAKSDREWRHQIYHEVWKILLHLGGGKKRRRCDYGEDGCREIGHLPREHNQRQGDPEEAEGKDRVL